MHLCDICRKQWVMSLHVLHLVPCLFHTIIDATFGFLMVNDVTNDWVKGKVKRTNSILDRVHLSLESTIC